MLEVLEFSIVHDCSLDVKGCSRHVLRLGLVIQTSMAKIETMSPYVAKSCVIALRSCHLEVLRHSEQSAKKVIRT
jgi:hypothetical protein